MTERIMFPDVERLIIDLLIAQTDWTASVAVPPDRTLTDPTFYVVRRVGGPRRNLVIDSATIVVESWSPDRSGAMAAAQTARAVLHAAATGEQIYRVEEASGPGNFPDTSTHPRYTQTFVVSVRGFAV